MPETVIKDLEVNATFGLRANPIVELSCFGGEANLLRTADSGISFDSLEKNVSVSPYLQPKFVDAMFRHRKLVLPQLREIASDSPYMSSALVLLAYLGDTMDVTRLVESSPILVKDSLAIRAKLAGAMSHAKVDIEWEFLESQLVPKTGSWGSERNAALALGLNASGKALGILKRSSANNMSVSQVDRSIRWIGSGRVVNAETVEEGVAQIIPLLTDRDLRGSRIRATCVESQGEQLVLVRLDIYHGRRDAAAWELVFEKVRGRWTARRVWGTIAA